MHSLSSRSASACPAHLMRTDRAKAYFAHCPCRPFQGTASMEPRKRTFPTKKHFWTVKLMLDFAILSICHWLPSLETVHNSHSLIAMSWLFKRLDAVNAAHSMLTLWWANPFKLRLKMSDPILTGSSSEPKRSAVEEWPDLLRKQVSYGAIHTQAICDFTENICSAQQAVSYPHPGLAAWSSGRRAILKAKQWG